VRNRRDGQVWVLSVVSGLVFAAGMTVYLLHNHPGSDPVRVVLICVIMGAFLGGVAGWFAVKQRRVLSGVVGDLSAGDQRAATSAASRGPAPQDPEIRRAAARIAIHQLNDMVRRRRLSLISLGGFIVLYVFLAATSSPWWWTFAVIFVGFLAGQLWMPGHLQRRIDLLTADVGAPPGD